MYMENDGATTQNIRNTKGAIEDFRDDSGATLRTDGATPETNTDREYQTTNALLESIKNSLPRYSRAQNSSHMTKFRGAETCRGLGLAPATCTVHKFVTHFRRVCKGAKDSFEYSKAIANFSDNLHAKLSWIE